MNISLCQNNNNNNSNPFRKNQQVPASSIPFVPLPFILISTKNSRTFSTIVTPYFSSNLPSASSQYLQLLDCCLLDDSFEYIKHKKDHPTVRCDRKTTSSIGRRKDGLPSTWTQMMHHTMPMEEFREFDAPCCCCARQLWRVR